jgi:hypothetical protein
MHADEPHLAKVFDLIRSYPVLSAFNSGFRKNIHGSGAQNQSYVDTPFNNYPSPQRQP